MRIVINDAEEIQKGKRFRLVGFFGIASTSTHPDITKKVTMLRSFVLQHHCLSLILNDRFAVAMIEFVFAEFIVLFSCLCT